METVNIQLPPKLLDFVKQRIADDGFSDVGEYVRQLIRNDQQAAAQAGLDAEMAQKMMAAMADGMPPAMAQALAASMAATMGESMGGGDWFEPPFMVEPDAPRRKKKRPPRLQ